MTEPATGTEPIDPAGTAADLTPWIEAGLYDPDHPDAAMRAALVRWLDGIGLVPEDFAGVDYDQLVVLANMRWLRRGRRYGYDDAATATGLDRALFDRVTSAGGYGPGDTFTQLDIDAFGAFGAAASLFSDDELLHFTRVISSAMTRIADAATALFRLDIGSEIERRDLDELAVVQTNYEAGELIESIFVPMRAFFLHELELAVQRSAEGREGVRSDTASTLSLSVGFVDLVGFTPLSEQLDPDVLGDFMAEFEEHAYQVVGERGGRVVKLIGDEVMFVTPDADAACDIALALVETFDAQGVTPRGGLSHGEIVARGGDYYGRFVNLAARAVDVAEPGTVLCGPGLVDAAIDHQLRGFRTPHPEGLHPPGAAQPPRPLIANAPVHCRLSPGGPGRLRGGGCRPRR